MRKGLQKMFLLSGAILVMGGCGSGSSQVENHMETLEESSLQHELQTLINYENQLQEDFETSLEGEDLSNFSEASGAVFSNMDSRRGTLESLTEEASVYESLHEELEEISFQEDEAEIEEVVTSMMENLGSINGTMESFLPQYEETLSQEREYFNSLGEQSADFEHFSEGIGTVNEQHETLDGHYQSLNESLTNLNENKDRALEIINEEGES